MQSSLDTYYVETQCVPGEIHINIVVVDANGRYRGTKHSTIRSLSSVDEESIDSLRKMLRFGGSFSSILTMVLRGEPLVICGEEEACQYWSRALTRFFAIRTYETTEWFSLIEEVIRRFGTRADLRHGTMVLCDAGLINHALKVFPDTAVVELRRRTVHRGKDSVFAKNLVKMLNAIPASEGKAMVTLVNTQIDGLRTLLTDIVQQLRERISDTLIVGTAKMSEIELVEELMRKTLSPDLYASLGEHMKHEELFLLAPHIIRAVKPLADAVSATLERADKTRP